MARRFGTHRQLRSGRFQASFVAPDGGRVTAPMTFACEADAETWLTTQESDIIRGVWKVDDSGLEILRDYALRWLASRTDLKPRTMALYAGLLDRHILPSLGGLRLRDIKQPVVRQWFADLDGRTGPTARAQSYRLLRTVLGQAQRDGEIATNPCQIRKAGIVRHDERRPPTLPEVHKLAEGVPARYGAMVLVAAYGGLRFSELIALTRADVILPEDGLPKVPVRRAIHRLKGNWVTGTPKSAAGLRTVTLPEFLGPVLQDHLDRFVPEKQSALVFATRSGQPLQSANFGKTWRRVREDAGLPEVHFHDLRHAAATLALQSGATLKDTMARLGHSSPQAALIYQHAASDRDELIAAALNVAAMAAVAKQQSQIE
jgi:integrase